jgi:hypothetical protein
MYDRHQFHISDEIDSHTRVGDADRERTTARLRHHHAEGRITIDEFQERLDRCYEATTAGQLRELVADLPREPQRDPYHFSRWPRVWPIPILLTIVTVAALTSGHGPHVFLVVFIVFLFARFFLRPRRMWGFRDPRGDGGPRL